MTTKFLFYPITLVLLCISIGLKAQTKPTADMDSLHIESLSKADLRSGNIALIRYQPFVKACKKKKSGKPKFCDDLMGLPKQWNKRYTQSQKGTIKKLNKNNIKHQTIPLSDTSKHTNSYIFYYYLDIQSVHIYTYGGGTSTSHVNVVKYIVQKPGDTKKYILVDGKKAKRYGTVGVPELIKYLKK